MTIACNCIIACNDEALRVLLTKNKSFFKINTFDDYKILTYILAACYKLRLYFYISEKVTI